MTGVSAALISMKCFSDVPVLCPFSTLCQITPPPPLLKLLPDCLILTPPSMLTPPTHLTRNLPVLGGYYLVGVRIQHNTGDMLLVS